MQVEKSPQAAVSMFYCYGVVMLSCMCVASGAGLLVYRLEAWPMDTGSNPARALDAELLLGSSLGSWLMSWCSVVAVAAAGPGSPGFRWTCLAYSLLLVLEKCVQNLFIVESLYRRRGDPDDALATEVFCVTPPYDGIVNHGYETQEKRCTALEGETPENRAAFSRKQSGVTLPVGNQLNVTPGRKRQILKNITIFLFMCNISVRSDVCVCMHMCVCVCDKPSDSIQIQCFALLSASSCGFSRPSAAGRSMTTVWSRRRSATAFGPRCWTWLFPWTSSTACTRWRRSSRSSGRFEGVWRTLSGAH